jgi:transcriptional regulator with XRE-family HTH domain
MPSIVSGRQLRAARVLAGLTQAQFAAKAGFHERACRYWEAQGNGPPTSVPSTLEKINAKQWAWSRFVNPRPAFGLPIGGKSVC